MTGDLSIVQQTAQSSSGSEGSDNHGYHHVGTYASAKKRFLNIQLRCQGNKRSADIHLSGFFTFLVKRSKY